MLFVVRFFPEIIVKSRPVRKRFIRILRKNLRTLLLPLDPEIVVSGDWDLLEIETQREGSEFAQQVLEILTSTPGIDQIMQVKKTPLPDFDGILAQTLEHYRDSLEGKSFAVRCQRQGRHAFRSIDVERHVGAGLLRETGARKVQLVKPEVTVRVDIRHEFLFVVEEQLAGLGGYPLGSQDPVLSLISGGFDSSVSSFQCIRRGLLTHYLFFNLGGKEHELAVKEVALYLWMRYGASQRVKFISVPFEAVVEEILQNVSNSQMGVVLKRMMLRAADRIAQEMGIEALATGESVAQVSSQTLANLALIDQVSETLVLRPLITSDKQDIIDIARRIGTEEFSRHVPEYCGVISVKPTTRARRHKIEAEEASMDLSVLDEAVKNREVQRIDRLVEGLGNQAVEPEELAEVPPGSVVVDIRHPDEQDAHPLRLAGQTPVLDLPFYRLRNEFAGLDQQQQYLLYCDKGIMSRLHASHLKDSGHNNVAVYRPGTREAPDTHEDTGAREGIVPAGSADKTG